MRTGQTPGFRDAVVLPLKTIGEIVMTRNAFISLGLASCLASFLAGSAAAQPAERAIGKKLVDGQAYVTLVRLSHQANPADNGRLLIAFEENGMDGIPIYESRDEGE